jgi:hypothetical protein
VRVASCETKSIDGGEGPVWDRAVREPKMLRGWPTVVAYLGIVIIALTGLSEGDASANSECVQTRPLCP